MNFLPFLLLSLTLHASSFLPENDLSIPLDKNKKSGISERDFNETQTELEKIYSPIVKARGGFLVFKSNWESSTVNAYASRHGKEDEDGEEQEPRNEYRVIFLGGLARHKFMTRDGFSLVICHELGHHLAGAPALDGDTAWASIDGQSDYFATSKCLRRLWSRQDNARPLQGKRLPEILLKKCQEHWSREEDKNLCLRSGMAAQNVGQVFGDINRTWKTPNFETPDLKVVKKTFSGHPKPQCRLDTYFQGVLCEVSFKDDFGADPVIGSCHPRLGHQVGARPLCWFKPE